MESAGNLLDGALPPGWSTAAGAGAEGSEQAQQQAQKVPIVELADKVYGSNVRGIVLCLSWFNLGKPVNSLLS